jgi:Bromodomain
MNDVTTHKYAGIFAKPLSEREAPGYKDLIYRPQDLKSIKTAIGRGSRAANAAIDDLAGGEDGAGVETPSKGTGTTSAATSGMTLSKKTDELAPPKGIVNSSQLEMELMRMFANAVMFNPLPAHERDFGPRFKMYRLDEQHTAEQDGIHEADEEGAKGYSYALVEGGIIADTREMFEHVEKSVGDWRSAELGLGETTLPRSSTGLGLRGGSISSALGEDNEGLSDTEGTKAEAGSSRKRRRAEA